MLRLDKRLRAVVDEIRADVLADIGCDHGKVSAQALKEGRARKVIACDVSSGSLEKARVLAKRLSLGNMECRLGDGLRPLCENEADCAVIAGMGGNEIISILSDGLKGIKRFILVAHRKVVDLRRFLSANGLYVDKDYTVEENGKFYDIIVALADSGRDCALDERSIYIGKNSCSNPDFVKYSRHIREKYLNLKDYADETLRKIYGYCMKKDDLKIKDVTDEIERHAPLSLMLDFDSAGLNQGDPQQPLKGIMLAENATFSVLEECRDKGCNLLVTHHPSVFGEERDLYSERLLAKAREYGVNLYSCHTNLDCCKGGLNDCLCDKLGLKKVKIIDGCAREGVLAKPLKLKEFASLTASLLKDGNVKYVGDGERTIEKIAVCTGAGARDDELVEYAKNNGVDCIASGESKISVAIKIRDYDLTLVDFGHYNSEIFCIDIFRSWLDAKFGDMIAVSESDTDPYVKA